MYVVLIDFHTINMLRSGKSVNGSREREGVHGTPYMPLVQSTKCQGSGGGAPGW
jgi:hypothetical protein